MDTQFSTLGLSLVRNGSGCFALLLFCAKRDRRCRCRTNETYERMIQASKIRCMLAAILHRFAAQGCGACVRDEEEHAIGGPLITTGEEIQQIRTSGRGNGTPGSAAFMVRPVAAASRFTLPLPGRSVACVAAFCRVSGSATASSMRHPALTAAHGEIIMLANAQQAYAKLRY